MWPGSCCAGPGHSGRHAAGAGARSHRCRRRCRGAGQRLAPAGGSESSGDLHRAVRVAPRRLSAGALRHPPDGRRRHRPGDRAGGQCPGVPAATASPGRACDQAMGQRHRPCPGGSQRRRRSRTPACSPGHGTTASSPWRQSRPAGQPGTHERACGGTCGPRPNEPYHGPTAPCWILLRSCPRGPARSPGPCPISGLWTGPPRTGRHSARTTPRYCGTSPVPSASLPTCDLPRPALR